MKTSLSITLGILIAGQSVIAAEGKVDFAKEIHPILEQQCVKCHGAEKQKGKLRLDNREAALKGGKGGPSLVPGDSAKSEFLRRVMLPKSDDDFMPSEGEPLPTAQLDLLKKWIDEGAVWPVMAAKETAKAPVIPAPVLPADFKPSGAEQKAIAALGQKGIDVRPIAANLNWREANFRLLGTGVTDTVVAPVKDIAGLVDLNLANTKITDAALANLKGLTNLQRLHLELTGVTDAGLAHLKSLPNLTYLNLYGTKVTDAGLEHLKDMKFLRNLYVWQSKVTEAGAKNLKAAMPNLEISTGWDLSSLPKKEEPKKDEKKDAKKAEKKEEKKEEKK